jgi:adenosylcobinamide kinase / adenosylcobinamide-phosphate guanylyltransferase
MEKSSLIFITGGVRSGKSSFAESLAASLAADYNSALYYLACGRPTDLEMEERINKHKQDRQHSEREWINLEFATGIHQAVPYIEKESVVLLDCLTTLLDNEMFPPEVAFEQWKQSSFMGKVKSKLIMGISELMKHARAIIIVSNEVLFDALPDRTGLMFVYSKTLGCLHQKIVSTADQAYLIEAGTPILMKG